MITKKRAIPADSEHPIVDHAINALGEVMVHPAVKTGTQKSLVQELIRILQSDAAKIADGFTLLSIRPGQQPLQLPTGEADSSADRFLNRVVTELWTIGTRRAQEKSRGIGRLVRILNAADTQIHTSEMPASIAKLRRKLNVLNTISKVRVHRGMVQRRMAQMANASGYVL